MSAPLNQQTAYPLLLALSVAFFLHVVVATLAHAWLSQPVPNTPAHTVSVRIAPSAGSTQTTPVKPATSTADQDAPAQDTTETSAPEAAATTTGDKQRMSESTTSPTNTKKTAETTKAAETAQDKRNQGTNNASPDDSTTTSEANAPVSGQEPEAPVTRLSEDTKRQRSAYEITLWERIAQAVAYTPLLEELQRPRKVVLALRLMRNGALRQVRVTTSSGTPGLDEVAREAALAATPFPNPPEGRRRFNVRLVFEPAQPE